MGVAGPGRATLTGDGSIEALCYWQGKEKDRSRNGSSKQVERAGRGMVMWGFNDAGDGDGMAMALVMARR